MSTLMRRIRTNIHDNDKITYTDEEIVDVINCGLRFIRRTIADIQPEILATKQTGLLEPGDEQITLDSRPLAIVEVTAGADVETVTEHYGNVKIYHNYDKIYHNHTKIYSYYTITEYKERLLKSTNLRHLPRGRMKQGEPCAFYRMGPRTICLFPVPKEVTSYTVLKIDDITEVDEGGESPLPTDYDDFLIEYATIRLTMGNEYDVSQEQTVMSNIYGQIQTLLYPPPPALQMRSYWNLSSRRGCCRPCD